MLLEEPLRLSLCGLFVSRCEETEGNLVAWNIGHLWLCRSLVQCRLFTVVFLIAIDCVMSERGGIYRWKVQELQMASWSGADLFNMLIDHHCSWDRLLLVFIDHIKMFTCHFHYKPERFYLFIYVSLRAKSGLTLYS